ncbi:MAG TPA: VOC family protein [Devosia sp.]|nr:VOC family protein [Devosia sp.]
MKFRYTILYVKDVKATLDFYGQAFDCRQKMLHESGEYGELETGETVLAFASLAMMKSKNARAANVNSPSFEIAFETDDVAGGVARACGAGASLVKAPEKMSWGQTVAYVSDMDGFLVEICTPIG